MFAQNGFSLKTQMRIIGQWWGDFGKKNILIAPWVLHLLQQTVKLTLFSAYFAIRQL